MDKSVEHGLRGIFIDPADAFAILPGDIQKSSIAPKGAPGVHHDPVLVLVRGRLQISIADYQDCVISICPAGMRCYNATFVEPEHISGSLDCRGHWYNFDSSLEGLRKIKLRKSPAFRLY